MLFIEAKRLKTLAKTFVYLHERLPSFVQLDLRHITNTECVKEI